MASEISDDDDGYPWLSWALTGVLTLAGVLIVGLVISVRESAVQPVAARSGTADAAKSPVRPPASPESPPASPAPPRAHYRRVRALASGGCGAGRGQGNIGGGRVPLPPRRHLPEATPRRWCWRQRRHAR